MRLTGVFPMLTRTDHNKVLDGKDMEQRFWDITLLEAMRGLEEAAN